MGFDKPVELDTTRKILNENGRNRTFVSFHSSVAHCDVRGSVGLVCPLAPPRGQLLRSAISSCRRSNLLLRFPFVCTIHDVCASNTTSLAAAASSGAAATAPSACRKYSWSLTAEVVDQLGQSRHVVPLQSLFLLLGDCPWLLHCLLERSLSRSLRILWFLAPHIARLLHTLLLAPSFIDPRPLAPWRIDPRILAPRSLGSWFLDWWLVAPIHLVYERAPLWRYQPLYLRRRLLGGGDGDVLPQWRREVLLAYEVMIQIGMAIEAGAGRDKANPQLARECTMEIS